MNANVAVMLAGTVVLAGTICVVGVPVRHRPVQLPQQVLRAAPRRQQRQGNVAALPTERLQAARRPHPANHRAAAGAVEDAVAARHVPLLLEFATDHVRRCRLEQERER